MKKKPKRRGARPEQKRVVEQRVAAPEQARPVPKPDPKLAAKTVPKPAPKPYVKPPPKVPFVPLPFALKERIKDDPTFSQKVPQKPGPKADLIDLFKFIGCISMVCEYVGELFFPAYGWLQFFGRMAFPIFLFFVGTGTLFTIDLRLVLTAVAVSVLVFIHNGTIFPLNVFFTIIIVRACLKALVRTTNTKLLLYGPPALGLISPYTTPVFEFGSLGLAAAMVGFMARRNREDYLGYYVSIVCAFMCAYVHSNMHVDTRSKFFAFFITLFAFALAYCYRVRRLNRMVEPRIPQAILIVTRHLPEFYLIQLTALFAIYHFHQFESLFRGFKVP